MTNAQLGRPIHVVSTKYDGSAHWEFDSFFVLENGPLLIATNFAGQQLHNKAGPWTTPFDVRNHFWSDRWYNVMRCDRPKADGLEYWYCNVTTPALYDGETLRYVDLDLDVRVYANGRIELLDEDEFLENSQRMGYPPDVIEQARRAADELVELATKRRFPFELPA
jgi:protein associated with RNAse G/E